MARANSAGTVWRLHMALKALTQLGPRCGDDTWQMEDSAEIASPDPAPQRPTRSELCRPDGTPVKIVVIDDERVVAEMVSMTLRSEGADVAMAWDGTGAISAVRHVHPDMVILDPRLPDMASMHFLRTLREISPGLPILLLKAPKGELDRAFGVAAGEPWLAKPFSAEAILLRVRTMLQRNGVELYNGSTRLVVGDLDLDEDSRQVLRGGESISMTYTEFELLRFLMRNSHRVVTKQEILNRVWPYDFTGRVSVVELYVSYLRRKIDMGRQPLIRTLRHTGYILKSADL